MIQALLLLATASAGTARFDGAAEGLVRRLVTDDGVTLSQLDNRLDPVPGVMTVERASDTLAGMPGFSAPNALGFGGYAPGPGAAFSRFGEVWIAGRGPASSAVVETFGLGNTGLVLHLDAWRGGAVVASDTVPLDDGFVVAHHTLRIDEVGFDRLRLWVGPGADDAAFLLLDDVRVDDAGAPVDTGDTDAVDTGVDRGVVVDTADTAVAPDGSPEKLEDDDPPPRAALPTPDEPRACGCASAPAPSGVGVVLLALLAHRRRRR